MNYGFNSLLGVLILIGDIWAILNIFQSSVSNEKKLLWIIVVVLLPLLGLILWYFLDRGTAGHKTGNWCAETRTHAITAVGFSAAQSRYRDNAIVESGNERSSCIRVSAMPRPYC